MTLYIGQDFNPYRMFTGIFIPAALAAWPGISPGAKLVYGRLCRYAGSNGEAWPKQKVLARQVGLTLSGLRKCLEALERVKLIRVTTPKGQDKVQHRTNRYRFLWHSMFAETCKVPSGTKYHSRVVQSTSPLKESKQQDTVSPRQTAARGETKRKHRRQLAAHPRWMKYAERLHNAIQSRHKVNCQSKLGSWARAFYLLHTQEEVPVRRIQQTLRWYCTAYKNETPFLPVAESGMSFRTKFLAIENARKRMEVDNPGSDPYLEGILKRKPRKIVGRMTDQDLDATEHVDEQENPWRD